MDQYCIIVENTKKPLIYVHFVPIPAKIGRRQDGDMHVVLHDLDPEKPRISKFHASLEDEGDERFFVIDQSTNGTTVDGRSCPKGGKLPARVDASIIGIEHYRLRLVKRPVLELVDVMDGHPPEQNERWPLLPGIPVVIGDINGDTQVLGGECLDMPNADHVITPRIHLKASGQGLDWIATVSPELKGVWLNEKPAPTKGWFAVRENDMLKVGERRFAVIRYRTAPVQCGVPNCRLLTVPSFPPAICRFCKAPLDERAITIMGVVDE